MGGNMGLVDFFSSISLFIGLISFLGAVSLILWCITFTIKNIGKSKERVSFIMKLWGGVSFVILLFGFALYKTAVASIAQEADRIAFKSSAVVVVNGSKAADVNVVLKAFKERFSFKQSGSYPTEVVNVIIKDELGALEFELKRDSRNPEFYWVFYPRYTLFSSLFYIKIKMDENGNSGSE
jgi:hypothetical protein